MKNLILGLIVLLGCGGCETLESGTKQLSDKFIDIKVVSVSRYANGTDIYTGRYKNSRIPVLIRLDCPPEPGGICTIQAIPIDELNICNQEKDVK